MLGVWRPINGSGKLEDTGEDTGEGTGEGTVGPDQTVPTAITGFFMSLAHSSHTVCLGPAQFNTNTYAFFRYSV